MAKTVTITLNQPAIFSDLNKIEGRDTSYERDTLVLRVPQFRDLPLLKERDYHGKVSYCAMALAGLSEDDLDELSTSDGKQIIQQTLGAIIEFNQSCDEYWSDEIKQIK